MATPRYGIPEITSGQAQKEVTANAAFRALEQGASCFPVKDKDLTVPPGSPAAGDAYYVAASPTGAWAGKAGQIAHYQAGWNFLPLVEGVIVYAQDENAYYTYNGSGLVAFAGGDSGPAHVVLANQAAYDALTPDPDTFYFIPE